MTVVKTNAGFVGPGQTAKSYVGKITTSEAGVTTQALETVTAKKTFYITDIYIASAEEAGSKGANMLDVRIQSAGTDIFRGGVHNLSPIEMAGIETQPLAVAGSAVNLVLPKTTGTTTVWFNIMGFEQ